MYFLRDKVWVKPQPAVPFVEFYWAQHLRQDSQLQPGPLVSAQAYLSWLQQIAAHIQALPDQPGLGPQGQSPDALGRLNTDKQPDLGDLLCAGNEIGKLGMALAARGIVSDCSQGY